MKTLLLLSFLLASCATRPVIRKDIDIKVVSANEIEIRIPGTSVNDIELEDGKFNPSDSKADYSVVFFKEKDHFKGMTKKILPPDKSSRISFKIRSKDKIEIVHAGF
jgi:hypothetical protein